MKTIRHPEPVATRSTLVLVLFGAFLFWAILFSAQLLRIAQDAPAACLVNVSGPAGQIFKNTSPPGLVSLLAILGESPVSSNSFFEQNPLQKFSYEQLQMAMPMRITVWSESESKAESACKKAFARATQLVKIFSDYDPNSEINQLLQAPTGSPKRVSRELFEVLKFCRQLHEQSDGAFDPTAGPVIELWRQARRNKKLPDPKAIRIARIGTGFEHLDLDVGAVTLLASELRLDFGGVAKGYIGDQVIQLLRAEGVSIACYRAGGDVVVSEPPPNSDGWVIDVSLAGDGYEIVENGERFQRTLKPDSEIQGTALSLNNCAVSTSGDSVQFVEIDGVRYSHVVDPRTGIGVTSGKVVVVIAPTGMQSDALATAGCILPSPEFQKLLTCNQCQGWCFKKSAQPIESNTAN